ncbi:MAG: hypothetical protein IJH54_04780 [Clostridia bacterium]|nr:hypothetical protein [Clostridia bacterium]
MKERLRKFMEGRYGADALNRFLTVCGWVLLLVGFVLSALDSKVALSVGSLLVTLSWALLIFSIFRTLSKNTSQRASENYKYFVYKNKVTGWFRRLKTRWQDRKVHRYFKCPQCHATVRVPKGKGKIRITCPKCKHQFVKKS